MDAKRWLLHRIMVARDVLCSTPDPETACDTGALLDECVGDLEKHEVCDAGTLGATFTLVVPTWSTTKQGWYDGLDRYVAKLRKDGVGDYTDKRMLAQDKTVDTDTVRDLSITAAKLAVDSVETAKILDANVTGAKISNALGAWQSHAIGAGANWTVPAGIYIFASNNHIGVQVSDGLGGWLGVADNLGGAVISDGALVRLLADGTGATVNYRELT